jgi:large subunit ribosomal protein L35
MPKLKSHKGLLKRVKITGRGKVKWHRAFAGHLMSHKTANKKQDLRQTRCAKSGDIKRLKRMLHQPLTASDTADE